MKKIFDINCTHDKIGLYSICLLLSALFVTYPLYFSGNNGINSAAYGIATGLIMGFITTRKLSKG
jgi:hypothetical protein